MSDDATARAGASVARVARGAPTRRDANPPTSPMPAFAITSLALFMATLDNLVVTTALPVIRRDLNATIEGLPVCRRFSGVTSRLMLPVCCPRIAW